MVLLLLSTIDGNVLVGAGFLALIFWAIWLFTSLLAWLKTHWSKILFLVQIGTFLSDCFLWWILAFCLHFQLFVYKFNCLLSCLFTMSAVCLQCHLFAYKFSFWFRISAFCLQWFLKKCIFCHSVWLCTARPLILLPASPGASFQAIVPMSEKI